jgi:hypothetical protein
MILLREMFVALAVLMFFLFAGRYVLDMLQITEPALSCHLEEQWTSVKNHITAFRHAPWLGSFFLFPCQCP